jgi:hypothetical protein
VEVAVRESSGSGRCWRSLGRLKWSVLDAAGERGCEKVIFSPAAERGGGLGWRLSLRCVIEGRAGPAADFWVEGGPEKEGVGDEGV